MEGMRAGRGCRSTSGTSQRNRRDRPGRSKCRQGGNSTVQTRRKWHDGASAPRQDGSAANDLGDVRRSLGRATLPAHPASARRAPLAGKSLQARVDVSPRPGRPTELVGTRTDRAIATPDSSPGDPRVSWRRGDAKAHRSVGSSPSRLRRSAARLRPSRFPRTSLPAPRPPRTARGTPAGSCRTIGPSAGSRASSSRRSARGAARGASSC